MPENYGSAGFLYHPPSGKVLLHHRDADAPRFPNLWSGFGGMREDEDGDDPVVTWQREMREELGIALSRAQIVPLRNYLSPYGHHRRYIFYVLWPALDESFVLGEGDGFAWFTLADAVALPDLIDLARNDLVALREAVERLGDVPGRSAGA